MNIAGQLAKYWFLLLTAGLVLSPLSCGLFRNTPEEIPYLPFSQYVKDYTLYQPGSYWIYQDSANTSRMDSVYVKDSYCDTTIDEQMSIRINQEGCISFYRFMGLDWFFNYFTFNADLSIPTYVLEEILDGSSNYHPAFHFFEDKHPGDSMFIGHLTTYISDRLPSVTLLGNSFNDVVVVTHGENWAGNPTREIWWAPHVGIIRRVMWDGTTWKLLRWNAVQ